MSKIQIDAAVLEQALDYADHASCCGVLWTPQRKVDPQNCTCGYKHWADKIDAILRDHAARELCGCGHPQSAHSVVGDTRACTVYGCICTAHYSPDTPTQSGECEPVCVCGHVESLHIVGILKASNNGKGECVCGCTEYRDRARGGSQ
jgi:hypothetical protein